MHAPIGSDTDIVQPSEAKNTTVKTVDSVAESCESPVLMTEKKGELNNTEALKIS